MTVWYVVHEVARPVVLLGLALVFAGGAAVGYLIRRWDGD